MIWCLLYLLTFRAYSLFYDESRSVQFLAEYQKEFLFNEDTNADVEDDSEEDEEAIKDETSKMETSDTWITKDQNYRHCIWLIRFYVAS